MSTVWVLSGETITDIAGEVLESGTVIGVYSSMKAAEAALDDLLTSRRSYWRKHDYDYSIDEFSLKG